MDDDDSNVIMPQRRVPVSQDNEDLVVKGKSSVIIVHSEAGQ